MGRLLTALLALGAIAAMAKFAMTGSVMGDSGALGTPKQRLDNVRGAAKRMEKEDQKRIDDMEKQVNGLAGQPTSE